MLSLDRRDTDEPLSVCALVGANGSGKSAILIAIKWKNQKVIYGIM